MVIRSRVGVNTWKRFLLVIQNMVLETQEYIAFGLILLQDARTQILNTMVNMAVVALRCAMSGETIHYHFMSGLL